MHGAEMKLLKSTQPLPKQTACQAGQPSSCPQHLALHKRGAGGGGAEGPPLPAASSTRPGEEGSGPRWPASLPPAPTRLWEEVSLEGIRR